MGEHTPGPWTWETELDGRYVLLIGADGFNIIDDGGAKPGRSDVMIQPDSPNGRLIAAAPDLLAACELTVAGYDCHEPEECGENCEFAGECHAVAAYAAIIKAEGKEEKDG